ncbi:hypothetical protein [Nitrosomonas sp.]|uniref:hypothetical protein n=1 Tax=Nitrosomonas sp. TaxID=42353 RepID=UPI0032EAAA78
MTEEKLPDVNLFSSHSRNEPPPHWVMKVRKGAPHLLDSYSLQDISYHVDETEHDVQKISGARRKLTADTPPDSSGMRKRNLDHPPVTWREKVHQKASHLLGTSDNREKSHRSYFYQTDKKIPGFLKRVFINDKWTAIKKEGFFTESSTVKQLSSDKKSDSLSNKILKRNTSRKENYSAVSTKYSGKDKVNFYFHQSSSKRDSNTASSDSRNEIKPVPLYKDTFVFKKPIINHNARKKIIFHTVDSTRDKANSKNYTDYRYTAPIAANTKHTKQIQSHATVPNNRFILEKPIMVHLHPQRTKKRKSGLIDFPGKSTFLSSSVNESVTNEHLIEPKMNNIISYDSLDNSKQYFSHKITTRNDDHRHKANKLFNLNTASNSHSKKNHLSSASKFNESDKLLLNKSQWPDLLDEIATDNDTNPWPQLSKAEAEYSSKLIELDHVNALYFQLQEVANRTAASELEQRGKLWSE